MTSKMDYQFPQQLFPAFFNCGPPDLVPSRNSASWGSYNRVIPQDCSGRLSSWSFTPKHQIRGETWCHTEPVPIPLFSPQKALLGPHIPPDPRDFPEHMQNFFMDNSQDAFGCMSGILGENFDFSQSKRKEIYQQESVNVWKVRFFLDILKYKICHQAYRSRIFTGYSSLMSDVIHDVPPELLGSLLYEELAEQRDHMLFCEKATGGALVFVPFSRSSGRSQRGCLIYPGSQRLDRLNFRKVDMHYGDTSCHLDASRSKPVSFQLKTPIRQISCASHSDSSCVAVRSDHFCGVWSVSERNEPCLRQVVKTSEAATCVSVSPHILGEVLVANKSRVVNLWTVGQGMQTVRVEDSNLYFNAESSWRWCEFSAHPRVMVYADRTGAELTDMRASPGGCHTLFHVSRTSECWSGERLILSKYLGEAHSFHHLVATQHSAYIVDERFPCVPMIKWDHMMQSPPVFCHVVPGSAAFDSAAGESSSTKVLLGSHGSQEIILLQYSGGSVKACFSQGPPQALLRPKDSLKHLPVQIPHRLDTETSRLSSPATGLTCVQKKGSMCVLQLTEAGDIFYQVLEHKCPDGDTSRNQAGVNPPDEEPSAPAPGNDPPEQLPSVSQTVISEMSTNDKDGPTQDGTARSAVAETPEGEQQIQTTDLNSASESESWSQNLNQMQLRDLVSEDQDQSTRVDLGNEDGNVTATDQADNAEKHRNEEDPVSSSSSQGGVNRGPVTLSNRTLSTWKHWLQKLMQKSCEKKRRPGCLQHFRIRTKGLLRLPKTDTRDSSIKECTEGLRKHLKSCMSRCSLVVHSSVSASLGVPDVVPVPSRVDPQDWTDPLSQRLTFSWKGESAWLAWWEEQLGMNRETKIKALRRKRRMEKEARRAAGRRLELTGSFTSSVSYQSETDGFSSSAGWSSATSQEGWSDKEGSRPLSKLRDFLEAENQRDATPSSTPTFTQTPTPATSFRRAEDETCDPRVPGGSGTLSLSQTNSSKATRTSLRKTKRPAGESVHSLMSTQDDLSQKDFLEKADEIDALFAHAPASSASSSQAHASQTLLRGSRLTLSQSSQGRLSQSSQHKKKSRMGF